MSKTLAPVASLLLGITFTLAGAGLLGTLLPLRGEELGFSAITIGLIGSAYYFGFVLGCLAGPYLILRAGHIRTFATLMALASAAALIHPVIVHPVAWIGARAITGFCLAGLYLVTESWLNDRATNDNRGVIMSAYVAVNFGATMVGQLMVTTAPISSFELFASVAILISIGVVPVALTTSAQPAPIALVQFRPLKLFRTAPVGITGSFLIGVANGAFWTLAPVFATGRGLSADGAAIYLSAALFGGAVMQWPVGQLSDRFDRRLVLACVMGAAAVVELGMAFLPLGMWGLIIAALLFGFVALTGYSVAAAHAYDRTAPTDYVEMATGILLANGVGAIGGPLIAAWAMEHFGGGFLFVHMALMQLLLVAFVIYRWLKRPEASPKDGFDAWSAAPLAGPLAPKHVDAAHPQAQTPSGFAGPQKAEAAAPAPDAG